MLKISTEEYLKMCGVTIKGRKSKKYKNTFVKNESGFFHSKGESERFAHLQMLEQVKIIRDLTRQTKFPLVVNDVKIGSYVSDFTYINDKGDYIVEDYKSEATLKLEVFKMKARLMKAIYGVDILITQKKGNAFFSRRISEVYNKVGS